MKSKYYTHVEPRLETIQAWKQRGLTDEQIAENLHICRDTFSRYKKQYPDLSDALKKGLDDAIAHVENAHFLAAVGYEYEEVKAVEGENGIKQLVITTKYMPPSVTAQIHFLKKRAPERWGDNIKPQTDESDTIEINVRLVEDSA